MQSNPQVPWTEEQWARVNQAIQEEAQRARVAATFLPLYGPLSADTDFVRSGDIPYRAPLTIADTETIPLATLQLRIELRGAQLADPEMGSALSLFRRPQISLPGMRTRSSSTDADHRPDPTIPGPRSRTRRARAKRFKGARTFWGSQRSAIKSAPP
jgi:hypothetical protein